ncbi:MAG: DinB family protein [Rectinemataceae bacterium]
MKDCLIAMAKYNRQANEAMCVILKSADKEKIGNDCGTFYHSALGALGHIAAAEAIWLKRFASFGAYAPLEKSKTLGMEMDAIKAKIAVDLSEAASLLDELDVVLLEYVEALSDAELSKTVQYKNTRGDVFEKAYWQTILHALTHGIHHRGEVSAMLDIQGIKNDFSGFTSYKY